MSPQQESRPGAPAYQQTLAKAGYDPPEFLSSHPSERTRMRQIEVWLPEAMQHYKPR